MHTISADDFRSAHTTTHGPLLDGDQASFHLSIEQVRLRGGGVIAPQKAGVTVIVGANNAGKSTILREIHSYLGVHPSQSQPPYLSVESVTIDGSETKHLIEWLIHNSALSVEGPNLNFRRPSASPETVQSMAYYWDQRSIGGGGLGSLRDFVSFYGNAEGRLAMKASAEKREAIGDPPQHPVHYLEDDPTLREAISKISERVFRSPLTLDGLARTVRLRVGVVRGESPPVDNVPREYQEAMAQLRALDDQGDGMRGFFGQVLPVMGAVYPLILLDEPEAFLHPPQAHALGVELGRLATARGTQIIVATHDRNLLTGLLDSDGDVSVVRVSRTEARVDVNQLDANELGALWHDPLLKYSSVLDGLFHRQVVLAEAEGDCAFLGAALDCPSRTEVAESSLSETLFVATGGKAAMWKMATALSKVAVPVVAAPDLDMISEQSALRRLVQSLGSEWTADLSELWDRATQPLRVPQEQVKISHVVEAITAVFADRGDQAYTADIREELQAQARSRASPWAEVKKHGIGAFTGDARAALMELLERLDTIGVVLVREGELERLAPSINVRKGPGWLQAALAAQEQCNAATQAHVDRILASASEMDAGAGGTVPRDGAQA